MGIYIAYNHAMESLHKPKIFHMANLKLALYLAVAFICRIPYMWNKSLARNLLFVNAIGWSIVTIIYFMA